MSTAPVPDTPSRVEVDASKQLHSTLERNPADGGEGMAARITAAGFTTTGSNESRVGPSFGAQGDKAGITETTFTTLFSHANIFVVLDAEEVIEDLTKEETLTLEN